MRERALIGVLLLMAILWGVWFVMSGDLATASRGLSSSDTQKRIKAINKLVANRTPQQRVADLSAAKER